MSQIAENTNRSVFDSLLIFLGKIKWRKWLPITVIIISLFYVAINVILYTQNNNMDGFQVSLFSRLSEVSLQLWTGTLLIYLTYVIFDPQLKKISDKLRAIISPKLELDRLCKQLADVEQGTTIYILNYWTTLVACPGYRRKFFNVILATSAIEEVRLLLVNPFHDPTVAERQRTLSQKLQEKKKDKYYEYDTVKDIISLGCLDCIVAAIEDEGGFEKPNSRNGTEQRIKVRLLNEAPPISLYTWGIRGSIGFFPPDDISSSYPQIDFPIPGEISDLALRVFDDLWNEKCYVVDEAGKTTKILQDLQWYKTERDKLRKSTTQ